MKGWNSDLGAAVRRFSPPAILFVALTTAWQVTIEAFRIPHYLIPSPSRIYEVFISQDPSRFSYHIWVTLQEILLGFAIGSTTGILIGIGIAYSGILEKTLYPIAVAVKVTPIIAIAPLLVIWFGPYIVSKVIVVAIISFFFPVVNTALGLRSVEPTFIDLMKSVSATEVQIFTKVKFPAALPYIFSALKVAITASVIGAVVGEFVGAVSGLGYLILVAASYIDTPLMFAIIITLAALGITLFASVTAAERIVIPWARYQGSAVTTS